MNLPEPAPSQPGGTGPASARPTATTSAPTDPAVLVLTLLAFFVCCCGWFWLGIEFEQTGWDFTGFYIAGHVPLESLYDQTVVHEYGRRLLEPLGVEYYPPYVRPAVFSLLLRTVTWLPYWQAFTVWAAAQFVAYLLAIYLLFQRFRPANEILVGFGLFYPAMLGIITGQDSVGVALLLSAGLLLLLDDKPMAAGLVLALCLYKFNLVFLIPVVLLIKKQFRVLGWFCVGGAVLAAASILLSPADQYLDLLQNIPKYTAQYEPGRTMIGFRSLSYAAGLPEMYYVLAALAAAFTVWAASRLPLTEAFCAALVGSTLCGFHVAWYDGVCLLVPIIVALAGRSRAAMFSSGLLLFLFPVWPYSPAIISLLILILWLGFTRPLPMKQNQAAPG